MSSPIETFRFRFSHAYRVAARPFRVTPARTSVELSADELTARFGPWRLRTRIDNIRAVSVTGPYAFVRTAGPARLGISDRSLTFATNAERGVELTFVRPVAGIEPTGLLRHPTLTLTLDDVDGFLTALSGRQANLELRS